MIIPAPHQPYAVIGSCPTRESYSAYAGKAQGPPCSHQLPMCGKCTWYFKCQACEYERLRRASLILPNSFLDTVTTSSAECSQYLFFNSISTSTSTSSSSALGDQTQNLTRLPFDDNFSHQSHKYTRVQSDSPSYQSISHARTCSSNLSFPSFILTGQCLCTRVRSWRRWRTCRCGWLTNMVDASI
jgi:hypothetical protein